MSWRSMMMAVAVAYADPRLGVDDEDEVVLTPDDTEAILELIRAQLDAFQRDDGEAAFALTAPSIRATFGTPDRFLEMVRVGYPAIYRPQSYSLGGFLVTPSGLGRTLILIGPEDEEVTALYLVEKQRDGSWLTNGCLIVEQRDLVV